NILLIWFIYSPFEKDSLPWLLIALIPVTYAIFVAPAELMGPKWPRNIAIETIIFYVGLGLADWLTPSAEYGWILFALLAIVVPIVTFVIRAPAPLSLPRWVRFAVGVAVGEGFLWFTFQILIFFLSMD
ncbi:MAG: hypothetical protein KDE04_04280, partial [Anaerolineales bacterium]|nr:hypothetical protein [Anaerolineales bacterium]